MKRLYAILVVLAAIGTCLVYLPLSWIGQAVVPKSFQPRPQFLGTFWKGQVLNIEGINPVNISVNPFHILGGKPPAAFNSHSPYLRFSGSAGLSGAVTVIANGNITGLSIFDPRFQTLTGTYDLSLKDMIIREDCRSAKGQLSTNILTENYATWQWSGPILSGPVTCEDGLIIAKLSGTEAQQSLSANFQIDLSGQYRADVTVSTQDPRAEFVLPLYGFEKTREGYKLSEAGTWQ